MKTEITTGKSVIEKFDNTVPSLEIKNSSMLLFDQNLFDDSTRIFLAYYEVVPNYILMQNIKYKEVIEFIETEFAGRILKKHYKKRYSKKKRKLVCDHAIYILEGNVLVDIEDYGVVTIIFSDEGEGKANDLAKKISRLIKRTGKTKHISIVIEDNGLRLMNIENKKPKCIFQNNYNNDLMLLHKQIVKNLNKKNENGLYLFHGIPGTGKSTYIRYLIGCLNKRVIFLPPQIAGNLAAPNLMKILLENEDSVLVIEDAEHLLASRESEANPYVSLLLNLTDGLLGESLGIQVICTFNTHVSNIDKALLRKGRLKTLYKFEALSISKSQNLLENIGINNYNVTSPMTLADIYNTKEPVFKVNGSQQKRIGFRTSIEELV